MIHTDKPPSPTKAADDNTDDVMVTSVSYTAAGNTTTLSKHSTKEEFSVVEKGKWKLDLQRHVGLSADEIHSGYLNRIHTSPDMEAGLLSLMKECFEVITGTLIISIYTSAAKSIGYGKFENFVDLNDILRTILQK